MNRTATAVVVALASTLVLAGCTSPVPREPAALRYVDEGTVWCFPSSYGDAALGLHLDPRGSGSISLTSVTAVTSKGLDLINSWVVPVNNNNRYGSEQWPIVGHDATWSRRLAAKNATISRGKTFDLVLHVRLAAKKSGSIADVRISYKQNGATYVADSFTGIVMKMSCKPA